MPDQGANYTPTGGTWAEAGRWGWTCPGCGVRYLMPETCPSVTCSGAGSHAARAGLRPERVNLDTPAPEPVPIAEASRLMLSINGAGTVERLRLVQLALTEARDAGAAAERAAMTEALARRAAG